MLPSRVPVPSVLRAPRCSLELKSDRTEPVARLRHPPQPSHLPSNQDLSLLQSTSTPFHGCTRLCCSGPWKCCLPGEVVRKVSHYVVRHLFVLSRQTFCGVGFRLHRLRFFFWFGRLPSWRLRCGPNPSSASDSH